MKKVISTILVLIMMVLCSAAFAEWDQEKDYDNLREYINLNDEKFEMYNRSAEGKTFYYYGALDRNIIEERGNYGSWDSIMDWFPAWYKIELEKECPEYGEITIEFEYLDTYNGTDIYHLIITGENDMVNFVDGEQTVVDIICVI